MEENIRNLFLNKKQESVIIANREEDRQNFIKQFCDLYRIDILKTGLDAILTATMQGRVKFRLELDRSLSVGQKSITQGYCRTKHITENHDNFLQSYYTKHYEIVIHNLAVEIIMHEITHALEYESALDIAKDFRIAILEDIKKWENVHMQLSAAIKQVLYEDIKLYPENQINSELLARMFQLIAMGKEVHGYSKNYHFKTEEVLQLFENTVIWIYQWFNQALYIKVNHKIEIATKNFSVWIKQQKQKDDFGIRSLHVKPNKPKWSKSVKSKFED